MKVERFPQLHLRDHIRKRCEEIVVTYPGNLYHIDRRCKHSAQYKINDIPFCERHAARRCLERLLEEEVK